MISKKKLNKKSLMCNIISNYKNKINTKNLPPSQIIKGSPGNTTLLINLDDTIKKFNDFNKEIENQKENNIIPSPLPMPPTNNKVVIKKMPVFDKKVIKLREEKKRASRNVRSMERKAYPKKASKKDTKYKNKGGKKINKTKKYYNKKNNTKKHKY
jgi:hypothetical protein